jgi:outer membrane protein TolC
MSGTTIAGRRAPRVWLATAALSLGGCASFSPDGGFGPVQQAAQQRLGKELVWARSDPAREGLHKRVAELLSKPLSADDAVQVALLNNRGLQAAFFELGISDADRVQAGRLANPGFTFSRLKRGTEVELERGLHLNLARLLAMPMVNQMEQRRFEQTQQQAVAQVLSVASDTRKAYYLAVGADETVRYMRQVQDAAEAGAELARRMAAVGNWNKLSQAREQSFYADAALNLARAVQAQTSAREKLTRLMGAWGEQAAFTLPERLPDLPKAAQDLPDVEQTALQQRLDVQQARWSAEQTAKNLGLTRTTRFVNVLELGLLNNRSNEAPTQRGYEIGFELPLFDWGGARVAKAEAIYMQSVERAAQTAIDARSEVREAYLGYRSRYDIARHYRDEIVPLKKRISDENLLRYNGMLIGVFELLADARSQIADVNGAITALRDFWIAQADLDMALIGKPSMAAPAGPAMATEVGTAAH